MPRRPALSSSGLQVDEEHAAARRIGFETRRPLHARSQTLHDVEAEARCRLAAGWLWAQASKFAEQCRPLRRGDAGALVDDGDAHAAGLRSRLDAHLAAARRELHRIGEEIA